MQRKRVLFGQGKKVLVTGATGFLGSHVVRLLLDLGFDVQVLKRSTSSLERICDITERVELKNIEDFKSDGNYDYFFHIATCYGRNNETREEIEYANYIWPLELIKTLSVNTIIVNFGTSLESTVNTYAKSKNKFISTVKEKFSSNTIVNLKLEHFFGPKDGKFIDFLISSFKTNTPRVELTEGNQVRDFIYYKDILSALKTILVSEESGDFEIGSGESYVLRDLILEIKELSGNTTTELCFGEVPYRENEVMNSVADISRIRDLGWKCSYSFREAILEVISI
ncbi:NAD-dependent epimerase/dehydratase family protein [Halobacteriovorax marinus]|uniref:NAD-dependent epimerase/dehydratase family protein n=1 Tax=Halobacteriovorax marinus TaxID=97084 RepID=UPI000BDEF58D|nr:NAD(P)-dependent oxidoreductase [Halobacteriovorax marinus]